ncbi:glycosyltransferase family 9 protein [Robbsia sp. KACC 23696]|uniref:glycosyltransferase family 9 protein n=1 Tax=Robbsia sp. KACC 23696 TaxID=3149231 RepID=UPI00325A9810
MSFSANRTFAFVMSPRLGDALLSMVVVNNLTRHGFQIKVFSNQIHALRDWFPGFDIAPGLATHEASAALSPYDVILHAYHADKVLPAGDPHPNIVVMDDWPTYRQVRNMVDIQLDVCRVHFGLADVVRENGMTLSPLSRQKAAPAPTSLAMDPALVGIPTQTTAAPPLSASTSYGAATATLTPRSDMRRVVIHPVASDTQKSWRPKRFVALALQLRARGFDPEFLLPQSAMENWRWLQSYGLRACAYPSLSLVAERIVTAGWVIGNDSGIGHLASCLGVPAVSLAMRPKIAVRWQPGWAPSEMVLPLPIVPGRFLKEKCWKYLVSPARVLRAFDTLRRRCGMPMPLHNSQHGGGYATYTGGSAPRGVGPIAHPGTGAETSADVRHAG